MPNKFSVLLYLKMLLARIICKKGRKRMGRDQPGTVEPLAAVFASLSCQDNTHMQDVTCPASLLGEVVKALGQAVVDDKSHVALVDAHTKSHRGHNDLNVPCTERWPSTPASLNICRAVAMLTLCVACNTLGLFPRHAAEAQSAVTALQCCPCDHEPLNIESWALTWAIKSAHLCSTAGARPRGWQGPCQHGSKRPACPAPPAHPPAPRSPSWSGSR